MSNTRFLTLDRVASATLLNGTGGGAPALEETSPYTLSNIKTTDRYTFWKMGAAQAYPVVVDIDLGAARTIESCFVLGTRGADTSSYWSTYTVESQAAYVPAGAWALRGTGTHGITARDSGVAFASASARYWRITFSGFGQMSLGRLLLGQLTDLGGISSPGGEDSPNGTRIIQTMVGGAMASYDLSDDRGRSITLPFNGVLEAVRSNLNTIAGSSGSVVLLDALDAAYECVVPDRALSISRKFYNGSQHVYDCNMRLLRLP